MDTDIRRELRILKGYAVVVTALLGTLSLAAFRQGAQNAQAGAAQKTKFTEIDVERINIVEPDGKLRMVISNRPRSIGPIYKGTPFGYPGGTRPGIIFFNDEGTENGGLTFTGGRGADGKYRASSGFSFDQFNQDQIFYFQYSDDNGTRRTGLTIADRADVDIFDLVQQRDSLNKLPAGPAKDAALRTLMGPRNGAPLFAQRVYVGRDPARSAVINLSDPNGRPRLRLRVDSLGAPSLEFLDDSGRVTARLPEARR
ncbi:MAG: hypothetical protein WKG32_06090 [Gemmatimonadaceae bacterium]